MKRITVPEPQIDLYNDGFEDHDLLGRAETGKKLSDLVERIDEPLVIALDGAWGSGKSHFLKCWVGEHLKRADNTSQTVYFDAFKHDYLDDPLIALTAAIAERLERAPQSTAAKAWQKAKNAAPFLSRAALRLGTAALVGYGVSLTGDTDDMNDIGDGMANEAGELSKDLIAFWKKEDGKRAAMEAFQNGLTELTEPLTKEQADELGEGHKEGTPTRKLVIVIDELDRCRPDYALQLLEIIKHFFNVPGVHFVLGVNLTELQNSVRARYGAQVDAERYLRKFLSAYFQLRTANSHRGRNDVAAAHLRHSLDALGLASENGVKSALQHFLLASNATQITLRDAEQIASTVALAYRAGSWDNHTYVICVSAACLIKTLSRDLFSKILNGKARFEEIAAFLGLPTEISDETDRLDSITWKAIALCTGKIDPSSTEHDAFPRGEFESDHAGEVLTRIAQGHLGTFNLDW